MNKIKNNLILITIIINMLYLFIGSCLKMYQVINSLSFSYGYIFILFPLNIFIVLLYNKKFKKDIIYSILLLLILFGIISTIFAFDFRQALLGNQNRYEGLLMIMYYFSIFFLSSLLEEKDKKKVIYGIIIIGFIGILTALFQRYELFNIPVKKFSNGSIKFAGFPGNPNFLATLILLGLSFLIGLFYDNKNVILIYILILLFTMGLLMTYTLSCYMGLAFIILYLIIFSIKFKKIKKLLILLFGMLLVYISLDHFKITYNYKAINEFKSDTKNVVTGNHKNEYNYGTGRIYIWKTTLSRVNNFLLTGVGIDNFNHILYGGAIYRNGYQYDKAHNEYLQILVCEGLGAFITYILFYLIIFIRNVKFSIKNGLVLFLLPLIGYFVQAFFNISVIEVEPLIYIALALNINNK